MMKENKLKKIITWIFYIIYIVSIGYFVKEKEFINIVISLVCVSLTILLGLLNRKLNRFITDGLYLELISFILISSLLGSCFGLYSINHYDDFLHLWSGFIGCSLAFSIVNTLNTPKQIRNMSKIFIILFLLMFSMGVAGFWEISEFLGDKFLGMNTQAGGLQDTMIDTIDALVGTIIMIPFTMKKINKI